MTDAKRPQPRRDEHGVPICSGRVCPLWRHAGRYSRCDHVAFLTFAEPIHERQVCEPQARLDAAQLDALQARYDTDVTREARKTDEWSARIVEATAIALELQARLDAVTAEKQNCEQANIDDRAKFVEELWILDAQNAALRQEVERLAAIEQRAKQQVDVTANIRFGVVGEGKYLTARFILTGNTETPLTQPTNKVKP